MKRNEYIKKYFKETSSLEYYITENILKLIENDKFIKELEKNIIILGFTNKTGKNALMILLENRKYDKIKKIINMNNEVLNYKSIFERNFLQLMLYHDNLHSFIFNIITNKDKERFTSTAINNKDLSDITFIDICIDIINKNDNIKNVEIILSCISHIYHGLSYDKYNILNKLCIVINNDKYLLNILEYININNNQELLPDLTHTLCIDYLLSNDRYEVLDYILDKVEYINFINNGKNSIFELVYYIKDIETDKKKLLINILMNIMIKSNIFKIRDIYNNNLLLIIIEKFNLEPSIINKIINNHTFDIYENNIYKKSIYSLIKNKYSNNDFIFDTKGAIETKGIKGTHNFTGIKELLKKTVIGVFNSDSLHNMIYTTIIANKYKKFILPQININKQINDINFINNSNNSKSIIHTLLWYKMNFYKWSNHIIIWNNINNYFIDPDLIPYLQKTIKNKHLSSSIIYIKLSIIISDINVRHANLLIIDIDKKLISRFEPYGEIYYESTLKLDNMIINEICNKLDGYNYNLIQSYPGFQSKSDELNENCNTYGDPEGYCLAWCYLFLEIKLLHSNIDNLNIIKLINNYVNNQFEKDFKINTNDNKYMIFIRYYSNRLDHLKNKLLKSYKIREDDIYKINIGKENYDIIINNINNNLEN